MAHLVAGGNDRRQADELPGDVSRQEADQIIEAHANCTEPAQSTALGGAIEIHGEGGSRDWTAGCVALENADVDVLWKAMGVNDTIVVLP